VAQHLEIASLFRRQLGVGDPVIESKIRNSTEPTPKFQIIQSLMLLSAGFGTVGRQKTFLRKFLSAQPLARHGVG
jgi:hypothetical protein